MVMGRAWYVDGQKVAFPHGKRLVSGPFETVEAAEAERVRLVPHYPDARLNCVVQTGKSLPVRTPRGTAAGLRQGEYDLRTVAGRRAAAEAIAGHARAFGAVAVVEDWDGEPDVDMRVPGGLATIWLGWTPAAPMPLISWVAADGLRLRADLPGAWRSSRGYAHRKATSEPADWAELFTALETGLCALVDGTALEE